MDVSSTPHRKRLKRAVDDETSDAAGDSSVYTQDAGDSDDVPRQPVSWERVIEFVAEYRQLDSKPGSEDDKKDFVTLTTIHQAKGLEWPVVVCIESPVSVHA